MTNNLSAHMAARLSGAGHTKVASDTGSLSEQIMAKLAASLEAPMGEPAALPEAPKSQVVITPTATPVTDPTVVAATAAVSDQGLAAAGGNPDVVAAMAAQPAMGDAGTPGAYGTGENGDMSRNNTDMNKVALDATVAADMEARGIALANAYSSQLEKIAMENAAEDAFAMLASEGLVNPRYIDHEKVASDNDGYVFGETLEKLASGTLEAPTAYDFIVAHNEYVKIATDIAEAEAAGEAQAIADVEKLAAEAEAEAMAQENTSTMEAQIAAAIEEAYALGVSEAQQAPDASLAALKKDPDFLKLLAKHGIAG